MISRYSRGEPFGSWLVKQRHCSGRLGQLGMIAATGHSFPLDGTEAGVLNYFVQGKYSKELIEGIEEAISTRRLIEAKTG